MHEKIIDYYNQCEIDYKLLWGLGRCYALHYGYYDKEHVTHVQAVNNMNRVLAQRAHVNAADHVLDAGCGIGGSSVWIAQDFGAKVTGVSVISRHIQKARELADKCGVSDLTHFELQNYNRTTFSGESFTVIWAIESVCHAEDKRKFLAEAWRLLKPGGRLIIADGFLNRVEISARERNHLAKWLDGWAVPNLAHINEFHGYLEQLGFKNVSFSDETKHVLPSSAKLRIAAIFVYLPGKLMQWLGIRTEVQMKNILSAYYQWSLLRNRVWSYGIFYAEKP
ncbi:MAG: methyltransferase domain-containing protein [Candidatus Sungbacteria bacterium]|nr:methyltransferase domain-containing protein [Candidatus Sungbacteria bacterium]